MSSHSMHERTPFCIFSLSIINSHTRSLPSFILLIFSKKSTTNSQMQKPSEIILLLIPFPSFCNSEAFPVEEEEIRSRISSVRISVKRFYFCKTFQVCEQRKRERESKYIYKTIRSHFEWNKQKELWGRSWRSSYAPPWQKFTLFQCIYNALYASCRRCAWSNLLGKKNLRSN